MGSTIFRFLCKLVLLNFFAKDSIRWSLLTIRGPHRHVAARDWFDFFFSNPKTKLLKK